MWGDHHHLTPHQKHCLGLPREDPGLPRVHEAWLGRVGATGKGQRWETAQQQPGASQGSGRSHHRTAAGAITGQWLGHRRATAGGIAGQWPGASQGSGRGHRRAVAGGTLALAWREWGKQEEERAQGVISPPKLLPENHG